MTSCSLAPPPVSPVPRHAITSFRAHRSAPPQTTRNCASRPKHDALPKARQDKSCVPQLPNFKPRRRRISTRQLTKARPKTRQESVLRLAGHQLRRCRYMPAERSTAQDEARARAASRSPPTLSQAGGGSQPASRPKHCPRQDQNSCCTSQHTNFNAAHPSIAMPPRRNSSCQRNKVQPKARPMCILPPAPR